MARNHSETKLHIAVAEWLRNSCPHVLWTHPANQGRSPQEGAKLKRMGVRAGVPDLLFWHSGWFGAIELKTTSGLSEVQKDFKLKFIASGGKYETCKTVQSVHDTLVLWGINPIPYIIKEPLPPLSVRHKAAIDFFRP
jgi:hypothetical protein